ncbi:PQQ-dependent sugar dehydrogenase [Candidatus Microgenomates bacterium]|nr:PQQ-dependent sugar dehydrogenase [Candidatus Microgenomates bacterium]
MKTIVLSIVFAIIFSFTPILYAQSPSPTERKISPGSIKLENGYTIEAAVSNLSVPTTAIFDGEDLIIAESGFANTAKPRILRIKKNGEVTSIAEEGLNPPVTGLLMIDKVLYVSHRGKVSLVQNDGHLKDIVTDLPSNGDHQNNNIVLGPDGKIYMGQGTVTNSAIVGEDNYLFGWLDKSPEVHEIPCKDITLTGINFDSGNPLTPNRNDSVTTGAYKPFGSPSIPNEIIKGNNKCGGSIVRFNKDGSDFELVAWGLRNPFGLEFDKNGQLWATNHGVDVRGSRSVFNDPDYLLQIKKDAWYGWPEHFDNKGAKPQFLWKDHPNREEPFMLFNSHAATNGLTISNNTQFGHQGDIFIAMFGTFAPFTSGINISAQGFRVVRVDTDTKQINDFASNTLPGPAYLNQGGGFDRPSDVVFGPDNALYVIDWGAATLDQEGLKLVPKSGVIWRIYSKNQTSQYPNGPIAVNDTSVKQEDRETLVSNALPLYKQAIPIILFFVVVSFVIAVLIFRFVTFIKGE